MEKKNPDVLHKLISETPESEYNQWNDDHTNSVSQPRESMFAIKWIIGSKDNR